MTAEQMQELFETSDRLVSQVTLGFHRYLYNEIDWRDRLICIMGARGTGKTTMMRQRIREAFGTGSEKAVYLSLDDFWFSQYSVKDAVGYLYTHGYTHVFIDEVHHFGKEWQQLIKNLYDQFPTMNFVYSGSSMLKLESGKADLSRRQAVYRLRGLSFREYLSFERVLDHRVVTLDELVAGHRDLASAVVEKTKILPHFERYQRIGFYPFYAESHAQYYDRLLATIRKVLESDYPSVEDVSQETIRTTKKMLKVLAASTPQTPNMSELYRELGTERNQGLKMLNALDRAGLLALVPRKGAKLGNLSRPEKIYCDNTNLMCALVPQVDSGVRRETYFFNQVRKDHDISFAGVGDFCVDGKYVFEVGGKGKGFGQIKDIPNSYVVNDDTEIGIGNKIPLWLFGFLY
jgi:hypothetical protein